MWQDVVKPWLFPGIHPRLGPRVPSSGFPAHRSPWSQSFMDPAFTAELVVPREVSRETSPERRVYRAGARRVCSGCGGPRDRGRYQAYCRLCHNDYARANRPKHSQLSDEHRRRANCRRTTNMMIARGKLERRPCACGSTTELQVRHRGDYSDPFNVEFVCKVCRMGMHHIAAA